MNRKILFQLVALVAAMMCALGASAAEAYANYTPSNSTLTFYYDDQFSTRPGTTYRLYSGEEAPGWYSIRRSVRKVEFDPSFADATPTGAFYWFCDMSNLQSITGIENLNTSNMTNMNGMFYGCSGLTSLDVSHFDTSNSTDMGGMFSDCTGLSVIDVSQFNTTKVENMWGMFQDCTGLTTLDLGSFDISKVKYISYMFNGCSNLTTIYAGYGWHGDAVEECNYMFSGCTKLVGGQGTRYFSSQDEANYACIDRPANNCPGWLTGKCYAVYTHDNTTLTFYNDCQRSSRNGTIYELHQWSLYVPNENPEWYLDNTYGSVTHVVFDPSFADARPTTTNNWFYRMTSLQSITGMDQYLNTEDVVNTSRMFQACLLLTSLDLSNFNTANVKRMNHMFGGCSQLRTIYVGDEWSTAAVTSSNDMFTGCTSLVGGMGTTYDADHVDVEYAHIDGGTANPGYFSRAPEAYACYTPNNTTLTFYYDNQRASHNGTTYDLNEGNNSPGWYTDGTKSSVTRVVFDPSFADARPTTAYRWFREMSNLTTIIGMMEYLNTSQVTSMRDMFFTCRALPSVDLTHFITKNVTDMRGMFYRCVSLTSLDLSSFNTANVTDMGGMFYRCVSLTSLDLSSFNTANVIDMDLMFGYCSNLTTIWVGDGWSTENVIYSDEMFIDCVNLVGGMGTTYDEYNIEAEYAHIDGGPDNPGYFTAKSLRGDVDGDGEVNINDVTALIDYLLTDDATGINLDAADCNGDSDINITDVTALIDYLLTDNW